MLTFLAGCPDHARGAVLHQPHAVHAKQAALHAAATVVPDSNPYAYLSIMSQASAANDQSARGRPLSNGSASSAAPVGHHRDISPDVILPESVCLFKLT